MENEVKTKRRYNSTRRQAQARETRHAVVAAAHHLFLERGYASTTIDAIAQAAEVAPDTVYAAFGSKRGILQRLLDVSVVGDDEPIPLLQRSGPTEVRAEIDQRRQIELFSSEIRDILTRTADVFSIMRSAAATESDLALLFVEINTQRLTGMMEFVAVVAANGPLRPGLSESDAVDTVWTLTNPEVYHLLTVDRNWSGEHYAAWLHATLIAALLPYHSTE